MPEFDPLAQQLVNLLLPYVDDQEHQELKTWSNEYGRDIDPAYRKDLYVRLSYFLMLRISREMHNERQQALVQDYEVWVLDPSPETKRALKNQRSRLYNNTTYRAQRYGESTRVSEALLAISKIVQPRQTLNTIVENILEATMVDEATFTEDKRQYQYVVNHYYHAEEWREKFDEYYEQRKYICSPQRLELLRFCISEFQRIATSPADILHVA